MPEARLNEILERLHALEREFEQEMEQVLAQKQEQFQYTLHKGRVRFERQIKEMQKEQKSALLAYIFSLPVANLLTSPIIYGLIIPLGLLDLMATVYQHICFRVYGIARVPRRQYIAIDRHHLSHLNAVEKFNCVYCGYGNGLIAYVREIAARTEQYWCPIKHARRTRDTHGRATDFVDYGDVVAYKAKLDALRRALRAGQAEM